MSSDSSDDIAVGAIAGLYNRFGPLSMSPNIFGSLSCRQWIFIGSGEQNRMDSPYETGHEIGDPIQLVTTIFLKD